jgi:hypothetical protein
MTMATLTARRIRVTSRTVGPKHDPYAREVWTLFEQWSDERERVFIVTECGLEGLSIEEQLYRHGVLVDSGRITERDAHAAAIRTLFELLAGISLAKLQDVYRRRVDFDDPMGYPEM